jgi:hypothetical protein
MTETSENEFAAIATFYGHLLNFAQTRMISKCSSTQVQKHYPKY